MSRVSQAELAAMRPKRGVRITRREHQVCGVTTTTYAGVCGELGCDWVKVASIRAIVEEHAGSHRITHRRSA